MAVIFLNSYQDVSSTSEDVTVVGSGVDRLLVGSNAGKSTSSASLTSMTLGGTPLELLNSHGVDGGQAISHGWGILRDNLIPAPGTHTLQAGFSASVSNNNTTLIELGGVNQLTPIGSIVKNQLTTVANNGIITVVPNEDQKGKFCLCYVATVDDVNNTVLGGHTLPTGFTRIDDFETTNDTRIIWGYINELPDIDYTTSPLEFTVSVDGSVEIDSVIAGVITINAVGEGDDETPPEFTVLPKIEDIGSNSLTITATSNEHGFTSSVVVTNINAPQPDDVVFDSGTQVVVANVEFSETILGIPAATLLNVWTQIKDQNNNRTTVSIPALTSHNGFNRVEITSVNPDPTKRIESLIDIEVGDIIDFGDIQGDGIVEFYSDGSARIFGDVTAFTVYVGNLTDGWGQGAVQYVVAAGIPTVPIFTNVISAEINQPDTQSFVLDADATLTPIGTGTEISIDGGASSGATVTGLSGQTVTINAVASSNYSITKTVGVSISGTINSTWTIRTRDPSTPTILVHIENITVTENDNATLNTDANGANGVPPYRWVEFNGVSEVTIPNENTNQLMLTNVQLVDNGRRFAVYAKTDEGGEVRSPEIGYVTVTVTGQVNRIVVGPLYSNIDTSELISGSQINGIICDINNNILVEETTYTTTLDGYVLIDSALLTPVGVDVFFEYLTPEGDYIGFRVPVIEIT